MICFCYPILCAAGIKRFPFSSSPSCNRFSPVASFLCFNHKPPFLLFFKYFSIRRRSQSRCATRGGAQDTESRMPNPEIAITIHAQTDPSSRPSEDFELVRYPTHAPNDWTSSHRQEELPFYMTEDTSARRRVAHPPPGPTTPQRNTQWDDEYDGEGKDVYAKASASQRYGGGGRIGRRAPPPPPASIVRLCTASTLILPH